ncbi:hypothetical protein CPS_4243 [Colwellia psychrerythraea 34H]|uniref:Uncharacterized protein n=1 Tax=Colwellia psychrerythraea (strain 34H / ATCC BAA-681) TaxID=167879 RepID=Q47WC9_COLP3|nr:hypothetical protein CPS_4243 [Colwellia psychrerythraea 34H]
MRQNFNRFLVLGKPIFINFLLKVCKNKLETYLNDENKLKDSSIH